MFYSINGCRLLDHELISQETKVLNGLDNLLRLQSVQQDLLEVVIEQVVGLAAHMAHVLSPCHLRAPFMQHWVWRGVEQTKIDKSSDTVCVTLCDRQHQNLMMKHICSLPCI